MKDKRKESLVIVKPRKEQKSDVTKKLVKEKVDIKNLAAGITKIKKRIKGSIILGCVNEREMKKLKENVQEKLDDEFDIAEPKKWKPKIKIINVEEEIMKLKDGNIIETIIKQNEIVDKVDAFYIRIVKKITKKKKYNEQAGRETKNSSLILEVDKGTHEQMLRQGKLNME